MERSHTQCLNVSPPDLVDEALASIAHERRLEALAKASSTLLDVELTRLALERRVDRLRAFQAVRVLWLRELEALPAESTVQAWDVAQRLQKSSPALSDFVTIVLGDFEDSGLVEVTIDGKLVRTDLTPNPVGAGSD